MKPYHPLLTFVMAVPLLLCRAPAQADPLRCDGSKLRIEARYYECCSRCDRRETAPKCEDNCKQRRDGALERIAVARVCNEEPSSPDPMLCTAQLLRVGADAMFCQSRCERRASQSEEFDVSECARVCDAEHTEAVDQICDTSVCATFAGEECM